MRRYCDSFSVAFSTSPFIFCSSAFLAGVAFSCALVMYQAAAGSGVSSGAAADDEAGPGAAAADMRDQKERRRLG